MPPLSLPRLPAGPRALSTVMVGSLGFLLTQDSACGGWTFLRKVRLLLRSLETAHPGEVLSTSQPGRKLPPLGCHHPSVSAPMPRAHLRPPGGTKASLQDPPREIHLGPGQRSLLLCEGGRAPNVISPALCSPTHCSLCKAQLTGRGQLNLTEVQGCLVGKVLAKGV